MITWFSAGARRARSRGVGLGWGLAFGLALLRLAPGAARAEEPAAPVVGVKARQKQELSEARLAAARASAGAGRTAEARALYGAALAAALAAQGQAFADAEAPRPTSVTAVANEQPGEEPPVAPPPALDREAEAAEAARAEAARVEAVRVESARAEAAAREEARQAAPPPPVVAPSVAPSAAPVVVATAPAAPPPAPPALFEVGFRSALSARDPLDGKHVSGGLVFTWLTLATAHGRGSIVVDLESTRWRPGRSDMTDRSQVAFYGLGFDWTVPFAHHGTGLYVGAEAAAGVLQGSSKLMPSAVENDGVLQVMPHAGAGVAYRGVGLFADAGWRFQLLANDASGQASVGGLVLQGGLRVEMEPGRERDARSLDLGYAARFIGPNGSRIYGRYGGLAGGGGSGPLLEHELLVGTNATLPRHADQALALTFLGADQAGGGTSLHRFGLGWLGTWHAFATRQLLNPYLGLRVGLAYMSNGDPSTFQYAKQVSALASGLAGLDIGVHRCVALRLGVAYDAVAYANNLPNASLSGYAVEAGVALRL